MDEQKIFYVYEHWRPDTDICFYVGKGSGRRAWRCDSSPKSRNRNSFYKNIVKKLASMGMCVEVRMVQSGMIEAEALTLERVRIAFWRAAGVKLSNRSEGGEIGPVGFRHSIESRAKIAAGLTKRPVSPATRAKISKKLTGHPGAMLGKKHTAETIAKMLGPRRGSPHAQPRSAEHCEKLSIASQNRPPISDETRASLSAAAKRREPPSAEARANMSASATAAWKKRRTAEEVQE